MINDFGGNKMNRYNKKFIFGGNINSDNYDENKGYGFFFDKDENSVDMTSVKICDTVGGEFSRVCVGKRDDCPIHFRIDVPKSGIYNVKTVMGGYSENSDISLLSQWRRFMFGGQIPKGEYAECEFTVNVCDVHRKNEERYTDRSIRLSVLGKNPIINSIEITETDAPTIYIGGDSTVTDQFATYPYNPKSTYCGWGQMIGRYLKKGIAVSNHAQSGLTTEEFMGIHWAVVKERIKKDDFLFLQFGHNDQKVKELDAFGGYTRNLKYYIDYARSVGAYPVLCTPINRIIFQDDGSLRDLLGEYGMAVRELAEKENVPCIDLLKRTTDYFTKQGDERAWEFFWGDGKNRDYTHTNDIGGDIIARFAAQEIIKCSIEGIKEYIREELIDVAEPEPIDISKRKPPSKDGLKPLDDVGLVNIPKFTDISGLGNSDKIKELSAKGIVDSPYGDKFMPDKYLSVKSAVIWAVNAAGIKCGKEKALNYGFNENIKISDKPITRCELAVLLINSYNHRAPDKAILGNIDKYTDRKNIPQDYMDYVCAANELGVLFGESETVYAPDGMFTRGEAADIFHKLIHMN